jgi:hypothetical membrane protein
MTERIAGAAGVAAVVVFWTSLFIFAASYPGYSHYTKAISELGAFGAPHALAWNLIGFIVPGVLLAVSGAGLARAIDASAGRTRLFWLLLISGLGFAGTGVIPAEMRDGSPSMQSPFTLGHVLMTFLSGIPWVISVFLLIGHVKRNPSWQHVRRVSIVLAVACVVGFAVNVFARAIPVLAQRPGLAQRISFAVYFGWFLVMALHLLSAGPRRHLRG